MADFQSEMHDCCFAYSTHFWTENPDSSHLWRQRKYKRFRPADSDWLFRFDMCRFGTRWRKRTRVATSVPKLRGLRMLCRCRRHLPLIGDNTQRNEYLGQRLPRAIPQVSLNYLALLVLKRVVGVSFSLSTSSFLRPRALRFAMKSSASRKCERQISAQRPSKSRLYGLSPSPTRGNVWVDNVENIGPCSKANADDNVQLPRSIAV